MLRFSNLQIQVGSGTKLTLKIGRAGGGIISAFKVRLGIKLYLHFVRVLGVSNLQMRPGQVSNLP